MITICLRWQFGDFAAVQLLCHHRDRLLIEGLRMWLGSEDNGEPWGSMPGVYRQCLVIVLFQGRNAACSAKDSLPWTSSSSGFVYGWSVRSPYSFSSSMYGSMYDSYLLVVSLSS